MDDEATSGCAVTAAEAEFELDIPKVYSSVLEELLLPLLLLLIDEDADDEEEDDEEEEEEDDEEDEEETAATTSCELSVRSHWLLHCPP